MSKQLLSTRSWFLTWQRQREGSHGRKRARTGRLATLTLGGDRRRQEDEACCRGSHSGRRLGTVGSQSSRGPCLTALLLLLPTDQQLSSVACMHAYMHAAHPSARLGALFAHTAERVGGAPLGRPPPTHTHTHPPGRWAEGLGVANPAAAAPFFALPAATAAPGQEAAERRRLAPLCQANVPGWPPLY